MGRERKKERKKELKSEIDILEGDIDALKEIFPVSARNWRPRIEALKDALNGWFPDLEDIEGKCKRLKEEVNMKISEFRNGIEANIKSIENELKHLKDKDAELRKEGILISSSPKISDIENNIHEIEEKIKGELTIENLKGLNEQVNSLQKDLTSEKTQFMQGLRGYISEKVEELFTNLEKNAEIIKKRKEMEEIPKRTQRRLEEVEKEIIKLEKNLKTLKDTAELKTLDELCEDAIHLSQYKLPDVPEDIITTTMELREFLQKMKDTFSRNVMEFKEMKERREKEKEDLQKELERYLLEGDTVEADRVARRIANINKRIRDYDSNIAIHSSVVDKIDDAIFAFEEAIEIGRIYEDTVADLEVLIGDFSDIKSFLKLGTVDKSTFEQSLLLLRNIIRYSQNLENIFSEIGTFVRRGEVSEEDRKRIEEILEAGIAKLYAGGEITRERIEVIANNLEKEGKHERAERLREIIRG